VNGSQGDKLLIHPSTILRSKNMPAKKKTTLRKKASAKKNAASMNK
jgi:hypothetical protein